MSSTRSRFRLAAILRATLTAMLALATAAVPSLAAQAAAQAPASIAITGDVPTPVTLTAADFAALPRATITTTSNGISTTYAGVLLPDVLKKSGLALGHGMPGNTLAGYVLAKASDGYRVLFSLGELDAAITDQQILIADSANGRPLAAEHGSFRLVLPKDKRGARSLRMLSSLEVVRLP